MSKPAILVFGRRFGRDGENESRYGRTISNNGNFLAPRPLLSLTLPNALPSHRWYELPRWMQVLLVVSFVLAAGPLWLSPEDLHDGLLGSARVAMGDLAPNVLLNKEANLLLFSLHYQIAAWLEQGLGLPPWVYYKSFNTACILWIGWELWCLTAREWRWPTVAAVSTVSLLWVFPVWSMLFASVQMVAVFVALVLWGHRRIHATRGWQQTLGWGAVLLSFHLNSNFAFVLGLEALRWAIRDRSAAWNWRRSFDLLALAFTVYGLSRAMAAPGGEMAGYNALLDLRQFDHWRVLLIGFAKFATFSVFALVLLGVLLLLARKRNHEVAARTRFDYWLAAGLFVLAFTAVFPYVAVGKSTALFFMASSATESQFAQLRLALGDSGLMSAWGIWSNRFALLTACVSALVCGALLRWGSGFAAQRALGAALGGVWLGSAAMLVQAHGTKLDQLAQVPAIVQGLRSLPPAPSGMLDIQATPKQRFIFPEIHEPNWFAYRAWGQRKWMSVLYYDDGASERIVRGLAERQYLIRANNPLRAGIFLADEYAGPSCQTLIQLKLPQVDRWNMLMLAGFRSGAIPAAAATQVSSECPPKRLPSRAKNFAEQ